MAELRALRGRHVVVEKQTTRAANRMLESKEVRGETLEIETEVEPGEATEFGLRVRKGPSKETVVGIDREKSELFVDRTRSGDTGFDPKFPGRHTAPMDLADGQLITLRIFVDRSSVEVFGNDGQTVISDLVFPSPTSQGVEFYSKGGEARVVKLDIWNLKSAWEDLARPAK